MTKYVFITGGGLFLGKRDHRRFFRALVKKQGAEVNHPKI